MSDHFEHEEHEDEMALDRLLSAAGKRWRRTMDTQLPEASAFVARMRQQLHGEDTKAAKYAQPDERDEMETVIVSMLPPSLAAHDTTTAKCEKPTQKGTRIMSIETSTSSPSAPVTPHPPRKRFAGVAAGMAALVIVALLAATLAFTLHSRQNTPGSGTHQKTPVVTAKTPIVSKTPIPNSPGAGPYDYRPLVIAPSNPQIAYTVVNVGSQPERSSDGGATFHPIATPPTTLSGAMYSIAVSPLDANHIIIAAYSTACVPQGDPQHRAQLSAFAGSSNCTQDFFSADGGQTWSALNLPFAGVVGYINGLMRAFSESYGEQAVLYAQGSRLYAATASSATEVANGFILIAPSIHLVVSNDDGASWQFADNGLGSICDFAPSPNGSIVYALASPGCALWRSDNAGASWSQINASFSTQDKGMIVASNGALYINTAHGVLVSVDGGKTFTTAPTTGLPPTGQLTGPIGVLTDGSVLMQSSSGSYTTPSGLYAWRPGEASWRQIGPIYSDAIVWAVIVPQGRSDVIYEIHLNESITHFSV